jgi:hypothetical protein
MKQKLSISVIITFLLLLFIAQSSQGQKKNQGAEVSKASQASFKWKTFTLSTTVGQLITLFGNYSKFIPCANDEDCNYFTYQWKISNGLIINALAMESLYKKANKQQKIGAYELSAEKNIVIDNLVFQLSLNKSSLTECKKKFTLKKSGIPNTWKFEQINTGYNGISYGNLIFTYLYFNDNGVLIKIGQYPFDRDSVG